MTMYIVDFPDPNNLGEWNHVGTFGTKQEAVNYIKKTIGCVDKDGNICLISEIMEDADNDE